MSGKGYSLKDQLFNAEKLHWLAHRFAPPFDRGGFKRDVMARLGELELKARINWIAECLQRHLPQEFGPASEAIRDALPPPLDPDLSDGDFGDFIFAPLGEFAVRAGLEDHPAAALDLLEELTQRFSMEWAIRPFLTRWPELSRARLDAWTHHPHYHVRRLVSEGTRPNLPWGMGIDMTPGAALPWLDRLHADPTRYVTRSVANHMNDISKSDPGLVVSTLSRWADDARQSPKELDWITRHALRSLVKSGHPPALQRLGYDPDASFTARMNVSPARLAVGGTITLKVDITGPPGLPVIVDYALRLHRPGRTHARKVFKLKTGRLDASGQMRLEKHQRLQTGLSSYRLHPGPQQAVLQINGQEVAEAAFEVLP